jgi:hypothetical protein
VFEMLLGAVVDNVTGVEGGGGLEEHDPDFFFGDGAVLHAARDDDELAGLDPFMALAEAGVVRTGIAQLSFPIGFFPVLHAKAAFDYEEHFVLVVVVVPNEFGVGFDQLYHLSVEFAGDVGLVVFGNFGEFFG